MPICFLSLQWTGRASVEQKQLETAYTHYQSGQYSKAISLLSQIKGDTKTKALISYWQGLCYSRVQNFDQAIQAFKKALRYKTSAQDIYYELGQVYFATRQSKKALQAFNNSINQDYRVGSATFYIGYIHYRLNQKTKAIDYYKQLLASNSTPEPVKQSAQYQMAEISYDQSNNLSDPIKKKAFLTDQVIPQYKEAIDYNDSNLVARHAKRKIASLISQYYLEESLSEKDQRAWQLDFIQAVQYNTNVISQAEAATILLSNTSALVTQTGIFGLYRFQITDSIGVVESRALF